MDFFEYFIVFVVLSILFWCYGIYLGKHFSRQGVKTLPAWPYFGNMGKIIFQREHFKKLISKSYKTFPKDRYMGLYQFIRRTILITDLELLKQLTIKDFDHFTDHLGMVDEEFDPIFASNLFSLKGQRWRDMRSTLTPIFTSSKMKNMFDFIAECGEKLTQFYMKEIEKPDYKDKNVIEVEMKDVCTRYTNDVIASIVFGISVDSHSNRDNYFYKMVKQTSTFSGFKAIKFFLFAYVPALSKFLRLRIFSEKLSNYFRDLVMSSMEAREEGNIYRPDMIQLLMEAKKGFLTHDKEGVKAVDKKEVGFATAEESSIGKSTVKQKWNDNEIVAQAIVFLVAGFDTSSTLLSFSIFEITVNPDVQTKLQNEIDQVALLNNGKVTYNDLQNMKYLDMVVSETLRRWPPGVATDRKCIKEYQLPPPRDDSDQRGYKLAVGDGIWVPIWGIHHDPKYYPNPKKFDPERFSEENKASIKPFTYLPFGIGPRNCIGSRFALMETKAAIFHLLSKFNFTVTSKTRAPIKLANNTFNLYAKHGLWVGLQPRVSTNKK